jgi:hypothetical protein
MNTIIQNFAKNSIKNLFILLGKELRNRGNISKDIL